MLERAVVFRTALSALLGSALACSLLPAGPGTPTPPPPTAELAPATETPLPAPDVHAIVTHQGSEFRLYSLDGALLESRPADGLEWARPNTAQVVGDDIYYVDYRGHETGSVVRRVSAEGGDELDFTAVPGTTSLTFAVSADGSRIGWAAATWDTALPHSGMWIASIDGAGVTRIGGDETRGGIADFYVLEAVTWLADGDLVYAWQISGIGGYILFFGWSSLFRYDAEGGSDPLTPALGVGSAPCWSGVTLDGGRVLGACGGSAQMVERQPATGVETLFPLLPDQGQAGAGAYSPSGDRLAYAIARGDPDDEAGQLILVLSREAEPVSMASHAPGAFDTLRWLDEERLVVGYWSADDSRVDLMDLGGGRSFIGEGRLIGVIWR